MLRNYLSLILFLVFSVSIQAQEIHGTWTWDSVEGGEAFSIDLNRVSKDKYQGNHCGVYSQGDRIDCNESAEDFSIILIRTSENIFRGSIRSSYSYSVGQVQLQYLPLEDRMVFTLTTPPKGEYYIPFEAIMQR